jgi:serine/threonine-protein kinase HipA
MISAYGKETAGALIFGEEGSPEPDRIGSIEPVDNVQIGAMLAEAAGAGPAFAVRDGDHLQSTSLAGIQPKIVLPAST